MHPLVPRLTLPVSAMALACAGAMAVAAAPGTATAASLPTPMPTISDFQWLTGSQTPPTEANCISV